MLTVKVAENPVLLRLTNMECKLVQAVSFGSLHPFTVHKIGDFPSFLSALACGGWRST